MLEERQLLADKRLNRLDAVRMEGDRVRCPRGAVEAQSAQSRAAVALPTP